jgi:uncharacterized membrane protein
MPPLDNVWWFLPAAASALLDATKDVISKRSLRSINPYVVGLAFRLYGLPLLLPLLLCVWMFHGLPAPQPAFWLALVASGTINLLSLILYMKAIGAGELSLTVPMVATTPLFLLITSPLINREMPSATGLAGVALIVLGSYILNLGAASGAQTSLSSSPSSAVFSPLREALRLSFRVFFRPFAAIATHRGSRLMLGVALLWSVSSNFDKIGTRASSPLFWTTAMACYGTLGMFLVARWRAPSELHHLRTSWRSLLPVGLVAALMVLAFTTAVQHTYVAYAISVKRTSVVIGVVFGWLLFREHGIGTRLLGALLMLAGVVVISVFG